MKKGYIQVDKNRKEKIDWKKKNMKMKMKKKK